MYNKLRNLVGGIQTTVDKNSDQMSNKITFNMNYRLPLISSLLNRYQDVFKNIFQSKHASSIKNLT